jgi:transposase
MVFLDSTNAEKLELMDARLQALKYSNLCRANMAMIERLEKINRDLAQALGEKDQAVLDAQAMLGELRGKIFGRSSERRDEGPGPLFTPGAKEAETEQVSYERKKRDQFGRTPQPELPRVDVVHELPEDQVKAQGLKKMEGQFEVSELINVTPSKFVVENHKRQKYVPEKPEAAPLDAPAIVTAPGPLRLKEGGRYSPEFGVEVGLGKYEWSLPLDRQVRMMKAQGLIVTSQVLFAQVDTIAWYLQNNVVPGILARIRASRVNQGDETRFENLAKDAKSRFWLWSVMSQDAVLFDVFDSRSKKVALEFLKGLEGVLLTDGYAVYQSMASAKLILANDWAHVRRKYVGAEKTHPKEAGWFLERIRALFKIEEKLQGSSAADIQTARELLSRPIVDAIGERCRELEKTTLPQSPLGKAIRYTLKLWSGLTVFLGNAEVPMDSNGIERIQRSPVVGRKNYYGAKSLVNARIAAVWYSVIQTCVINGVEPREYINETLRAILTERPVILPWDWPGRKVPEKPVSETVVFETPPGLVMKAPEIGPIAVSESVP